MPPFEAESGAASRPAPEGPTAGARREADHADRELLKTRPARVLSHVLAGINQLLQLEDFSRGDAFRD